MEMQLDPVRTAVRKMHDGLYNQCVEVPGHGIAAEDAVPKAVDDRNSVQQGISLYHMGMMSDDQAGNRNGQICDLFLIAVRRIIMAAQPASRSFSACC